jgi:hypothetical protein
MACHFMSADQAASIRFMAPDVFAALANYELGFGCTIKRGMPLDALADRGRPYAAVLGRLDLVHVALSDSWDRPVHIAARKNSPDAVKERKTCSPASRRARVGPGASAPLPGAPPVCGGKGSWGKTPAEEDPVTVPNLT